MVALQYIDRDIPHLKSTDTLAYAQELMNEFKISQLPVVDSQVYQGILSEAFLHLFPDEHGLVGHLELEHLSLLVPENYHFYEIARIASENLLEIVPVADDEQQYLGVVNMKKAALLFSNKFADYPIGGVFILSMNMVDYSLAEISRLVESNDAKILSCFVETDQTNPHKLLVTLKVNTVDLTRIIATFERFSYNVAAKYQDSETEDYNSYRLDLLLKYLEI